MSIVYLKVKIKSLEAEAKIIRKEERKHRKDDAIRNGLTNHRKTVVRIEQRATLLAYAFLRGKSYKEIEPKHVGNTWRELVIRNKVKGMVLKYSSNYDKKVVDDRLTEWFKAATVALSVSA